MNTTHQTPNNEINVFQIGGDTGIRGYGETGNEWDTGK